MGKMLMTAEIDLWDVVDTFRHNIDDQAAEELGEKGIDPNLLDDWEEIRFSVINHCPATLNIEIEVSYEDPA